MRTLPKCYSGFGKHGSIAHSPKVQTPRHTPPYCRRKAGLLGFPHGRMLRRWYSDVGKFAHSRNTSQARRLERHRPYTTTAPIRRAIRTYLFCASPTNLPLRPRRMQVTTLPGSEASRAKIPKAAFRKSGPPPNYFNVGDTLPFFAAHTGGVSAPSADQSAEIGEYDT